MGTRIDSWPRKDALPGMAVFFSQISYKPTREWKEEIVFWDPMKCAPRSGLSSSTVSQPAPDSPLPEAIFPDGGRAKLTADKDPRGIFADWLTAPGNSWFRQCIVNRIWYWLLGRGIVQEPDDIRPTNPPSNPALLAYLEKELLAGHYDLKHIYRLILNSQTYQLSSLPRSNTSQAEANFAAYPLRRLDAEVLIDAINKVTGTTDQYTSAIPEPFTYIPKDMPAIALGDGSITSPFLTLFGRSARSTGMADERDNKPVPAQYLHMLNSSHIQLKLMKSPRLREILMSNLRQPQALIEELYLTILSRYPTPYEMRTAWSYGNLSADRQPEVILGARRYARRAEGTAGVKRPRDWMDIAWALVNSTEFLYKH